MKRFIKIISIVLIFSMSLSLTVYAKTYVAGKTYTMTGKLIKKSFKHPGNGRKITNLVLKMDKKVKIKDTASPEYSVGTVKTRYIVLNPNELSSKQFKKLKKYNGKKVKAKGVIMFPGTAYYYYPQAMMLKSIKLK